MKKTFFIFALASAVCAFVGCVHAQSSLKIWEGVKMPGGITKPVDVSAWEYKPSRAFVGEPVLRMYPVEGSKGIVIICPGGAYTTLWSLKDEGEAIAKFLNGHGVSASVLEYRVPDNFEGALMDIQRAIRLVRAKAAELGIAHDKIAVMGFSAGASLAARASCNFKNPAYAPVDAADKVSARPDYTILIYPAYCSQPEKDRRFGLQGAKTGDDYNTRYKIADWNKVDRDTPPAFITQTQPDIYVDASLAYYLALKDAGVPSELHMLPENGHGYKDPDIFALLAKRLKERGF